MYVYQEYENKKKRIWPILILVFIATVSSSYLVQTYMSIKKSGQGNVERLSNEVSYSIVNNSENNEKSRADIIEEAMKSVVGISMLKANEESMFDISLTQKWGLGTGIIISEDGYILTNQHLARNENTRLIVNLIDGESVQGKVVWCDPNIDIAIVKIDKDNLSVAKFGNSDKLRIGDDVLAIGNPLGVEFQRSTTKGIVSGINRTLTFEENGETIFMEGLIQTDASINSGNSGGPLINENGEVIGVNTVKITTAEGMGFAVPINLIEPIINKLINGKEFKEGYLGMFVYDKEIIKYTKSNVTLNEGIYVTNISRNGPAEKAGIVEGDIIISVDGIFINKVTDMREYIYYKAPGDVISVIINRDNEILNVKLQLGYK